MYLYICILLLVKIVPGDPNLANTNKECKNMYTYNICVLMYICIHVLNKNMYTYNICVLMYICIHVLHVLNIHLSKYVYV